MRIADPVGRSFFFSNQGVQAWPVGACGAATDWSSVMGAYSCSLFFVSQSGFPASGHDMAVIRGVPYHFILVMACPWYGYDDIVLVALS